jgi:ParB-like chromosome segregation protein Spo0J
MSAGSLTRMHPEELRESPINPREISTERFQALKYALQNDPGMLEARPLIATTDGEVVAGNMRLRAIRELGWDSVPVFIAELDEKRKREWMLRDNQEYGTWIPDDLANLVKQHSDEDGDLSMLGFTDQDLKDLERLASGDMPEPGDAGMEPVPEVFAIVIDCADEEQQVKLLEELTERGLKARALMA